MNKEKLFIVMDLETNGFAFEDGVTEITAKYFTESNGKLEVLMNELTNPEVILKDEIVKLTGITNQMIMFSKKDYEAFAELSVKIDRLMKAYDVYLVAHNAEFEWKFLSWNLTQRVFKKLKFIDTRSNHLMIKDGNVETNKWTKNFSKLKQAAEHFGFEYDETKAHRAEYDVDLTTEVFKKQLEQLTIEEMVTAMKVFRGEK